MFLRLVLFLGAALLLVGAAAADVPQLINYQGVLLDTAGDPVTTPTTVLFAIWNADIDGDSLWSEQQAITPSSSGSFTTLLGSVSPIPDSAFSGLAYLSIKVESDPEMTPRSRLVSVGYAYRVGSVDGAAGGGLTGEIIVVSPGNDSTIIGGDQIVIRGSGGDEEAEYSSAGITIYESTSSLKADGSMALTPRASFTPDGMFIFGASEADTAFMVLSNGSIFGKGQAVMGQNFESLSKSGSATSPYSVWSTVFGFNNTASGDSSTVSGGYDNVASGYAATIGGGYHNEASEQYTTVGGGAMNIASYFDATVGGGSHNTASGDKATVAGGWHSTANGVCAVVGGGHYNVASGTSSFVGSGYSNTASGDNATVGGGESSTASGDKATVGGGYNNNASSNHATVGGGYENTASSNHATVGGGQWNAASADFATVAGGYYNTAGGYSAAVPGGQYNTASGSHSFAAGRRAKANHDGTFVWGDGTDADFTSTATNQFLIRAGGGVGIGRTPTANELELEGNASKTAAGDWLANSDAKIKTDVRGIENALAVINQLRPVQFKYTADYRAKHPSVDDRYYVNYIAQEFQRVFPDDVKNSGEDDLLQIDTHPAVIYAVAAIQELHKKTQKIEQLEAQMAQMQAKIQQLLEDKE